MTVKVWRLALVSLFLLSPFIAATGRGQETAASIIERVEERQRFETSRSRLSMIVYPDKDDEKSGRRMEVLAYARGEEDSYMTFISPRSIKGLSILAKKQDQWIYFPSTGRVRKIAGKSKGESVQGVGGDFSYEDLSAGKWQERYALKIAENTNEHWVLEGTPLLGKDSSYTRLLITIRKKDYQILRVDYFAGKPNRTKDLTVNETKLIGGRVTPIKITMTNHDKNSKTVIITEEIEYDIPIDDKYFNPAQFYK